MGFDIDLGEAIAKELGVKIEWQETAFAQMISSLVTGRVDIVMAGMSDLPGRREQVDFVDYLKTGAQFYTSQANAATIKTPADLCGKKVGASRSTNWPGADRGAGASRTASRKGDRRSPWPAPRARSMRGRSSNPAGSTAACRAAKRSPTSRSWSPTRT